MMVFSIVVYFKAFCTLNNENKLAVGNCFLSDPSSGTYTDSSIVSHFFPEPPIEHGNNFIM